jgi:sugar lactone lactonase YvrE
MAAACAAWVVLSGCASSTPVHDGEEADEAPGELLDTCARQRPMDDRTQAAAPLLGSEALEVVAELPYPPGNVTVSATGRVFLSFFPEGNRGDVSVAEWRDGIAVAFPPDPEVQRAYDSVLGLRVDAENRLWLLDYGHAGLRRPKLGAFDLDTGSLVFEYVFSHDVAPFGSLLNDFQIHPEGDRIFISDQSLVRQDQAIVVLDLRGAVPTAFRRLENHPSLDDGPYGVFVNGERFKFGGLICPKQGLDGLVLDPEGEHLYYASLNGGVLARVPTAELSRAPRDLADADLAAHVEEVADITMSDGMTMDLEGNVYLSDMEHSAVVRLDGQGELRRLVQDARLRWPDGFAWAPDGSLFVTASAIHTYMNKIIRTDADIEERGPYHVFKVRPQDACVTGERCYGR